MMKRTKKDEDEYDTHLRREEPIKTEVLVELRAQNKALWATQARLLGALLQAEEALMTYRSQAWAQAKAASEHTGDCVPGCTKHTWCTVDGWHRTTEGP